MEWAREEKVYRRGRERVDSLFALLNARIQSTLDELHGSSTEPGFAPFMPPMTDDEHRAWEQAWWNRKRDFHKA